MVFSRKFARFSLPKRFESRSVQSRPLKNCVLPASKPSIYDAKQTARENSSERFLSRFPEIENLLADYVHTYDNFLLRVEDGGDENGERTRSSRSLSSPTPASQDLARRPGGGGDCHIWAI